MFPIASATASATAIAYGTNFIWVELNFRRILNNNLNNRIICAWLWAKSFVPKITKLQTAKPKFSLINNKFFSKRQIRLILHYKMPVGNHVIYRVSTDKNTWQPFPSNHNCRRITPPPLGQSQLPAMFSLASVCSERHDRGCVVD